MGFEPTNGFPLPVFKTGAFNRSATLPFPASREHSPAPSDTGIGTASRGWLGANPLISGTAGGRWASMAVRIGVALTPNFRGFC